MQYIESNKLELKEKFNDKFIKEVVAFLNADGGDIIIGVKDNGEVIGVQNVDSTLKNISDCITDQIEPVASDCIKPGIIMENGKILVSVSVRKGIKPIYCIKKYGFSSTGCPIRIGSTCKEMPQSMIADRFKQNFSHNDLLVETPTNFPVLQFHALKQFYLDKGYHLNDESFEINLSLFTPHGKYNLMGELLSDNNRYSLIFVKFNGTSKASISQRSDYGKRSLLFAYEQLMNRISAENICNSDTTVRPRIDTYLYDYDSVNEAIINAIAHNDWLISEPQISFFSDRLEIISHGGLPDNLTKEEFFKGISKPRNKKLMKILSDLDIVEHTGHGIPVIIEKYGKEVFEITENYILVTIPFDKSVAENFHTNNASYNQSDNRLPPAEIAIIEAILRNPKISKQDLATEINKSIRTVERHLAALIKKGYIIRQGSNKTGQWKVIRF